MSTSSDSHGGRFVPRVGAIVAGKYRIERKLGEGGMGLVVAASHLSLGGQVALKFLTSGDELRQDAVTRFTREAQSVARIKSDHVARVLDMGKLDTGDPFIVMELLEGTDLHKFVRKNGPLPFADAVEYVLQASEGVAEAHAMGIVHRDLKPANLFLSHKPDGSPFVRVLDFGIAKNIRANKEAGDVSLTVGTDVLGSPLYMSPEQIRNPKEVDPRADVWSLGAILYKLLTGRAAFEADNPSASLAMIVMEDPTPLRQFRPDIPPQLEAVIHRCLEKKLDKRFQSVDELACALLPFAPMRQRGRPWVPTTTAAALTTTGASMPLATTGASMPFTTTGASMPAVVAPGQTPVSTQRSVALIAAAAGAVTALGLAVIVVWVVTSTNAKQTPSRMEPSASPAVEKASAPPPAASTNVVPASNPPSSSAVTQAAAPSSTASTSPVTSSSAPVKAPKRTDRNAALDDRL
jgi:serine/threonine protein kinase